jgi:hypothetical protein
LFAPVNIAVRVGLLTVRRQNNAGEDTSENRTFCSRRSPDRALKNISDENTSENRTFCSRRSPDRALKNISDENTSENSGIRTRAKSRMHFNI